MCGPAISLRACALALSLRVLTTPGLAVADETASSGAAPISTVAAVGVGQGPNPELALPIAGWLLYPSLQSGAILNDNLYQQPTDRRAGLGLRLRPFVEADRDEGLYKTNFYALADVQIYPGQGSDFTYYPTPAVDVPPTNATGRAGFAHTWRPLPDWTIQAVADYTRQNGLFGSNFGATGPQQLTLLNASTVSSGPQYSNQASGYVSAQKELSDRTFVRGTTGVQYVFYDSRPSPLAGVENPSNANVGGQNGLSYQASLRGGLWLTPQLYGFVEPGADFRFYENSAYDTNGYRVTGGLGSDQISLFRGEIYGGYQMQASARGYFGTASSPAFGARIFYYPTPYVTLLASLDETLTAAPSVTSITFGDATLPLPLASSLAPNGSQAASSKTLQARVQGDYALSQYWTAYLRGGYGETTYSTPWSKQTMWSAGAGVNYGLSRSVSLTIEYQFARSFATNVNPLSVGFPFLSFSSLPSGYAQNVASIGVTYRY